MKHGRKTSDIDGITIQHMVHIHADPPPRDYTLKLGWGIWQGETNGIDKYEGYAIFQEPVDSTDWAGQESGWWRVVGTDGYAAWFKPTFWLPLR